MKTGVVTVTALNLFPVRSCAAETLQSATVTPHGFLYDRNWRLVKTDGQFLTQRECPKMALIEPAVIDEQLSLMFKGNFAPACAENRNVESVSIYGTHQGIDQGDDVADWLKHMLGVDARLLRVVPDSVNSAVENSLDFARPDMSPVLLISEESLADLNTRLDEPVFMNRFRPNIEVRGCAPYAEEGWKKIIINDVFYAASSEPCGRCPMINVDQEKGEKSGKEPLKTLASYKRTPGIVIFGKYLVPQSSGVINVGDTLSFE